MKAMSGVQLKDRNGATDLMFMLGVHETIDQLVMANSVRWDGYVLRREDGHILRKALDIAVEGQRKKGRGHGKSRLRSVKCKDRFEKRRCTLPSGVLV